MIPIAREAWVYAIPVAISVILFFLLRFSVAGWAAVLVLFALLFFFRDPERRIPGGEGLVLAPADGRIVKISAQEGEGEGILVSIFLSLLDVHVNRSPVKGRVLKVVYKRGSFRPAFQDEASGENEQNILSLEGGGYKITMRQIAGVIARRVVCWVQEGEALEAGQRIGIIKFGSRVDLVLPRDTRISVGIGDKVKAGETIIGCLK